MNFCRGTKMVNEMEHVRMECTQRQTRKPWYELDLLSAFKEWRKIVNAAKYSHTGHYSWNDATHFLPLVLYLNYLFCLQILKFYPIRLSFIFFAFPNFNPGEHQSAQMTTTHKGPNMPPSKFHVSLWRPSVLQKRLWLIWVISLHQ